MCRQLAASEGGERLAELLSQAARELAASKAETPRLDAELILLSALEKAAPSQGGFSRSWILAHPDYIIEEKAKKAFADGIALRLRGLPVAYITGKKAFWKHEFEVTPDVLIPKPDTEILVERAEEALQALIAKKEKACEGRARLLDICAGSGCVAISLKSDFPSILAAGADISKEALAIAERNARKILKAQGGDGGIAWLTCDLREGIPAPAFPQQEDEAGWDVITANPPYVPSKEARTLLADGRGEPLLALDGGEDGLSLIKPLVFNAAKALLPGGFLLIEAGEYNIEGAASCFKQAGFADIVISRDLAGQKRVVEGKMPHL